jgi:choline dehydrogenase-like flavoprotein
VLLESGEDTPQHPDPLGEGEVTGEGLDSLVLSRRRGVGGTAHCWNTDLGGRPAARYIALDPIDFEPRSWVPHSGWPIGPSELARWTDRARNVAGLGAGATPEEYLVGLASVFTSALPAALRTSGRVQVRTGATVTRVVLGAQGERVERVEWSSRSGARGEVRAARFVLSMGAVENARQLLLAGIDRPWLGRGFMEHPRDYSLRLVDPTRRLAQREEFYEVRPAGEGWGKWGRLAIAEEEVRRYQMLNASATIFPSFDHWNRMRGPLRRLLGKPRSQVFKVAINLEQAPDRANRITLSTRTDGFGTPLPQLTWRWNAMDESSRVKARRLIRERLEQERFGRVEEREQPNPDPNAHHHSGTTRMASTPEDGVVDKNCKVFGVENLYVTGASVFPTSGFANPTLTILVLSLRLGDHIARGDT